MNALRNTKADKNEEQWVTERLKVRLGPQVFELDDDEVEEILVRIHPEAV